MPDVIQGPPNAPRLLRWTIFLGATAFIVYLCFRILSPFLNVLAWSGVLAVTFHPVYQRVLEATRRPTLSALICSALVVVAFVMPVLFMAGLAIDQLLALVRSVEGTFSMSGGVDTTTTLGRAYTWLTTTFGLDSAAIIGWFRQHGNQLTATAAQYTVAIATSVTGAVMSFIFIVFAMFLLFRDGDRMVARIPALLPFERSRSDQLLTRVRDVIYGGVYGVVVIAVLQGALCGGMFWLLGVPSAALWGTVTVLTSVLPVVGAAAVWVPGSIYLALAGSWTKMVILLLWGTFVISGVDNFLRPRLVGERVGLSELVMFFSLLGGLHVFGILGIVLGPVLFAVVGSIIEVLSDREAIPDDDDEGRPRIIGPTG